MHGDDDLGANDQDPDDIGLANNGNDDGDNDGDDDDGDGGGGGGIQRGSKRLRMLQASSTQHQQGHQGSRDAAPPLAEQQFESMLKALSERTSLIATMFATNSNMIIKAGLPAYCSHPVKFSMFDTPCSALQEPKTQRRLLMPKEVWDRLRLRPLELRRQRQQRAQLAEDLANRLALNEVYPLPQFMLDDEEEEELQEQQLRAEAEAVAAGQEQERLFWDHITWLCWNLLDALAKDLLARYCGALKVAQGARTAGQQLGSRASPVAPGLKTLARAWEEAGAVDNCMWVFLKSTWVQAAALSGQQLRFKQQQQQQQQGRRGQQQQQQQQQQREQSPLEAFALVALTILCSKLWQGTRSSLMLHSALHDESPHTEQLGTLKMGIMGVMGAFAQAKAQQAAQARGDNIRQEQDSTLCAPVLREKFNAENPFVPSKNTKLFSNQNEFWEFHVY